MGIGDRSKEKHVKKYPWEAVTVVDAHETDTSYPDGLVNCKISIARDHDAYERVCRLESGAKVCALPGDPDEPDAVILESDPNILLGPLVDSRSGQIARDMLLGARYQGKVIDVLPHSLSCDILLQLTRCVQEQGDDQA